MKRLTTKKRIAIACAAFAVLWVAWARWDGRNRNPVDGAEMVRVNKAGVGADADFH